MSTIKKNTVTLKNGEKLHYRHRAGDGDALILLHGNMAASVYFEELMAEIDEHYDVYAPDMRGFGYSTYKKAAERVGDYANDLESFTEKLGLETFFLSGQAFGAAVAMRFALDNPKKIKKLILLSTCGVAGRPIRKRVFFNLFKSKRFIKQNQTMKEWIEPVEKYKEKKQQWIIKQMLNKYFFTVDKPTDRQYDAYIEAFMQQRNLADVNIALSYFNIFSDDNGVTDGTHEAKNLELPILMIHGDKDEVMPVGVTKFNERAIGKNASTEILSGVGHMPQIDDLKKVVNLYEVFMED